MSGVRGQGDFDATVRFFGKHPVGSGRALEWHRVSEEGAEFGMTPFGQWEQSFHIVAGRAAADSIGQVLVVGLSRREGERCLVVYPNGGDHSTGANQVECEPAGVRAPDRLEDGVGSPSPGGASKQIRG